MWRALFVLLLLTGCAASNSELYPADNSYWMRQYSVTHDPHHPWQFQNYFDMDSSR